MTSKIGVWFLKCRKKKPVDVEKKLIQLQMKYLLNYFFPGIYTVFIWFIFLLHIIFLFTLHKKKKNYAF